MAFRHLLALTILSHSCLGQEITIDTVKVIEEYSASGELIEYHFQEFKEPIYVEKNQAIKAFQKHMSEIEKMDRFEEKDSTRVPYSAYLEFGKCVRFLMENHDLYFDSVKTAGFYDDLSVFDLTDRFLGEIICDLLDEGKFAFKQGSLPPPGQVFPMRSRKSSAGPLVRNITRPVCNWAINPTR